MLDDLHEHRRVQAGQSRVGVGECDCSRFTRSRCRSGIVSRCSRWAARSRARCGHVGAKDPGHGRFAEQQGDQAALAAAEVGDPGGGHARVAQHGVAEDGEHGLASLLGQGAPGRRGARDRVVGCLGYRVVGCFGHRVVQGLRLRVVHLGKARHRGRGVLPLMGQVALGDQVPLGVRGQPVPARPEQLVDLARPPSSAWRRPAPATGHRWLSASASRAGPLSRTVR